MDLHIFKDKRGLLIPVNFSELPFDPKRIFIVSDVPGNCIRGKHAHFNTQQLLLCLEGQIQLQTTKDCLNFQKTTLNKGEIYFHDKLEWLEMFFPKPGAMLISFCSTEHDEKDYIRDFDEFCRVVLKND